MSGLLDMFSGSGDGNLSPQQMGLLGLATAMGNAYAPQPASRLPLAQPSIQYLLSQAAGGYGTGYQQGQKAQEQQAKNYADTLANLGAVSMYNIRAPILGVPQVPMSGMPQGAPQMPPQPQGAVPPSMPMPPPQTPVGGAAPSGMPPMAAPVGPPQTSGDPQADQIKQALHYAVLKQAFGIPLTPTEAALMAANISPGSQAGQNLLGASAVKTAGLTPTIGGERPGVPLQTYNPATGKYEMDPNSLKTMAAGAFTNAQAAGQGGLGAKEAESAFNAGLKVKTENQVARNQAFYSTGQMPPDALAAGSMTGGTDVSPSGDLSTPKGTVVPPPPKPNFMGTDALTKQNANTQDAEKNFGALRGTLDQTESRMVGLAKALQTVQSGGLSEHRAEIANTLRGAGFSKLADTVMSAKDTAAVQTGIGLQTLDILGQLKAINAGTGGRILNSEFTSLLDKQYGPDLSPQANYDLITSALGGVYQTRNMIDDYFKYGKPGGWRDANGFMSAYYSNPANSMTAMTDQAGKAIGQLKGMDAAPTAGPQAGTIQTFKSPNDPAFGKLPPGSAFYDDKGTLRFKNGGPQ